MSLSDLLGIWSITQTVAPATEPVTTEEAMRHLRKGGVVDLDSKDETQGNDFNNLTDPLTVTSAVANYANISFAFGSLIKIDDEILEVSLVSGNDVTFRRAVLDTEIKNHTNTVPVYAATGDELDVVALVVSAREYAEEYQWSSLITQTFVLRLDAFPLTEIELPRSPLSSVTSLAYNDSAGASQTLTVTTDYTVDANHRPGRIVPAYQTSWPTTRGHIDDVTVTYVAGYGGASSVPLRTRQAIKLLIGSWYWQRDNPKEIDAAHDLLDFDSFRHVFG